MRLEAFQAHAFDGGPADRVQLLECRQCHFAWQGVPARTEQQSAEHFRRSFYERASSGASAYFDGETKSRIAALELEYLQSLSVRGPRLLDVGCGDATFARLAAQAGWQATAIDPALDPSTLAGTGVRGARGTLDDLDSGEQFDVVTLWDVIEHVPEPRALIREVFERVAPGGLVVVETGNYKSADRVESGRHHWMFQLDHRWYFSPESLGRLLEQAGFDRPRLCDRVLRPGWRGRRDYAGPSARHWLVRALRQPSSAFESARIYRELLMARRWEGAGLGIFCLAAQRPADSVRATPTGVDPQAQPLTAPTIRT